MNNFKVELKKISPVHDNPTGLIHPYWARKPLNIVETIVRCYSEPGETVADPFMGSGTTIIAALKNNRNAVGSDLSPISHLIVKGILNSSKNPERFKEILIEAINVWTDFAIFLYSVKDGKCVERENFKVEGEFKNGLFKLIRQEVKIKPINSKILKGKVEIKDDILYLNKPKKEFLKFPIDFAKINYVENSRIAVHKGTKASDFFTKRNIVFINYAKDYISKKNYKIDEINFLKLFLSSMIPLLRLSDKKASSQWPYWRPKNYLTSRNPIGAINRRKKAYLELLDWEKNELDISKLTSHIHNISAKKLFSEYKNKVDLIITDPPYADHAPYMEYSDLYWSIINDQRTSDLWNEEIVKTNAIGREKDSLEYESRMSDSFSSILRNLKPDGYFIFFYLDKNIKHWNTIKKAIRASGCDIEDVFAIPKQRRSMKAVTSPGKTLDGDLIIICKKVEVINNGQIISIYKTLEEVKGTTYFLRFAYFIKKFMMNEFSDLNEINLVDISKHI
jgi:DNA modification methylase